MKRKLQRFFAGLVITAALAPSLTIQELPVYDAMPIQFTATKETRRHQLIEISDKEVECLARNAYHEARGEPKEGIIAVIAVALNRRESVKFPSNACEVVYQKRVYNGRVVCQFSWHCDSRIKPADKSKLLAFEEIVKKYVKGVYKDPTEGSLFFHTNYVKPSWSRRASSRKVIGNHIFYKDI